jgi:fused signal recognition particle receptor
VSPEGADPDRQAWAELFGLDPGTADDDSPGRRGLFARLRENLTKPRQTISPQLAGIFAPKLVTAATWEELEDALITADVGVETTLELVEELRARAAEGLIASGADLARALRDAIASRMAPEPPRIPLGGAPTVILIVASTGAARRPPSASWPTASPSSTSAW